MKRRICNFGIRNSIAIALCVIALIVLLGSHLSVSSKPGSSAARQDAPTVTTLCFTGRSLAAGDLSQPVRLNTVSLVDSTGCNVASTGCLTQAGSSFFYDVYTFRTVSCGAGQNPSITAQTCGTAPAPCNVAGTLDTVIGVYQLVSGGVGVASPFDATNPCLNNKAGDNNGCSPQSLQTVTLCPGIFVVVVWPNTQAATGNYTLSVAVNAGTACQVEHLSNNPTAISLSGFTVKRYESGALIEWQTGSEIDNLGFNVYRKEKGKRVKINPQIIAGSALLTGPGTNLAAGGSYSWWDDSPQGKRAAKYYLEEIKLSGESVNHGPLVPDDSVDPSPRPNKARSTLLSNLATSKSSAKPVERSVTTAAATATADQVNAFASRPAVKLSVKQEGWYRVSQQDLVAAGLDSRTDPRNLQLFVDGNEQAILVQGEQAGKFDAVEFYGVGLDIPSTDSRTYWLAAGSAAGQRISQAKAKAKRESGNSFAYIVERRDQTIFVPSLKTDSYFGAIIAKNPTDQSLDLPHVDQTSSERARIDISLQGLTQVQHQVKVLLNDDRLGEMSFDGQTQGKSTFSVPQARLKQGANKITLIPEAGDTDFSVVDTIRITYQHTYSADGDALRFTASPKRSVTVDGFTNPAIRVVDITDPNQAKEVTGKIRQQGSGYAITIGVPKKGERTLLAFADNRIKRPASIAANQPTNWREPNNQADLLVIGHRDFLGSVSPLVALRQSQGMTVAVADVEDVYDEFSFGNKTPQAIKDFLSYATTSWQKAPRFVLLVGDATNDPRNFLGNGDFDFVPTKMVATQYNQTASDSWFADFADNGLPEIAIGRLPARSAEEADTMIAKIVGFDQTSKSGGVLLVSDINDGSDFERTSAELRSLVPAEVRIDELRRSQMDPAALRSSLIDNLNRGGKIVNYVGHGSVEMWRGGILTPADARSLTNSQSLPFFISTTCLNGYFQDPVSDSLAESLMKAERGGGVGVWASSGFVEAEPQAVMNKALFGLIFGSDSMTVGEMLNRAKASVSDIDVRRTYTLFGDPTMKLR